VRKLIKRHLHINVKVHKQLEKNVQLESGRFGRLVNFCEIIFLCKIRDNKVKINYDTEKYQDFAWVDMKMLREKPQDWPLESRSQVVLFKKVRGEEK